MIIVYNKILFSQVNSAMAVFGQNQLQFNLACPPMASRLAVHFHKPEAIKFEKLRCVTTSRESCQRSPAETNAGEQFNLTSVSQERMDVAIQLAKRDVKRQNQTQVVRRDRRSVSPKASRSKTTVIHGKEYWDRQRRWRSRPKKPLTAKEHDKNREVKVAETQTPPRSSRLPG